MKKHYFDKHENLVDLFAVAFYNSSWFSAATPKEYKDVAASGQCREDKWAAVLLKGGFIWVADWEEDEKHKLTLKALKEAWDSDAKDIIDAKAHIINRDADINDADAIIQRAIFGEVVYG